MAAAYIQVPKGLTTDGLLGKRYLARGIDTLIVVMVCMLVFAFEMALFSRISRLEAWLLLVLTVPPIWILYGTMLESAPWQATIGKKLMGLRVYGADGERLSPVQAFFRSLAKDGPFLLLAIVPGGRMFTWIWIAAHVIVIHRSPVNQAIHDRVAGTWVAAREETIQLRLS